MGAPHAARTRAGSSTASSRPSTRRSSRSPAGCCVRTAAPCRSSRRSCARPAPRGCSACAAAHEGEPPKLARERTVAVPQPERPSARRRRSRPSGSPSCRRCSRTCSPPAATAANARLGADELAERFHIPREELAGAPLAPQPRQLRRRLLHGLRRARGRHGARRQGALRRRVPAAPRLTPLEARAIRLALDIVGPTIAARVAHAARPRPQEARGDVRPVRGPRRRPSRARARTTRRSSSRRSRDAIEQRRVVEIEYLKEGEEMPSERLVEPYTFERELPHWLHPHVGPHARRRAHVPARPDALGAADRRDVRAARGLRSALPRRHARRPRALLRSRSRATGSSAAPRRCRRRGDRRRSGRRPTTG